MLPTLCSEVQNLVTPKFERPSTAQPPQITQNALQEHFDVRAESQCRPCSIVQRGTNTDCSSGSPGEGVLCQLVSLRESVTLDIWWTGLQDEQNLAIAELQRLSSFFLCEVPNRHFGKSSSFALTPKPFTKFLQGKGRNLQKEFMETATMSVSGHPKVKCPFSLLSLSSEFSLSWFVCFLPSKFQ